VRSCAAHHSSSASCRSVAQQQQRRGDAAFAQVHRLFERAQAEAPRAFFHRNARHVERTVAVSLVLDDSH